MALGHIDQWLILFAIALIHNHVANALHCGNTVQNIQLEQFCDCQVDCKNQYDEIGCAPINATAVQNSVTSCKGNSCSLNDGIVYTQLCKPLTCPLWKFNTRTQSTQNASCVKLPCIAGCLCGLSYMKCESGRRTKSIKRMMIPYQHVSFQDNYYIKFPIDPNVTQPWIIALNIKDNMITNENLSEALQNLPNLRLLQMADNYLKIIPNYLFKHQKVLLKLDLTLNRIKKLEEHAFSGMERLKFLHLSNNPLHSLPRTAFKCLQRLQYLKLLHTLVYSLDDGFLQALPNLLSLNFEGAYIRNLPNGTFKNSHQLQDINLDFNNILNITKETFRGLRGLRILNLRQNPIQAITSNILSEMPILYGSFFINNKINKIAMGAFRHPRLTILDFAYQSLPRVECGVFSHLPRLRRLRLFSNGIRSICDGAFRELRLLYLIDLSNNTLSVLTNRTFYGLRSLRELFLNRNNLTRLPNGIFLSTPYISKLHLGNNYFEEFDENICKGLRGLQLLIIWWNYLKAFNVEGLRYCWHSLGELIASNNLLTSLNVADLSKFSRLFVLYLNGNDISNYHGLTSASPFKRFKTVILRSNEIVHKQTNLSTGAFHIFRNTLRLDASGMDLRDGEVSAISNFNKLQLMKISQSITHANYSFSAHPHLKYLDISGLFPKPFQIESYKFAKLYQLQVLYLNLNRIQSIKNDSFPFLPAMTTLELQFNEISLIERSAFNLIPNLQILNLTSNKMTNLTSYQFDSLLNLKTLDFTGNLINVIEENAFTNLVKLQQLILAHNMINSLPNLVFQNLPQVYEVVFHGNKIKSFDLRCVANLPTLRILALGWNRLQSISYTSENGTAPPLRSISSLRIYGNQLPSRYLSYFKNTLLYQIQYSSNNLGHIEALDLKNIPNLRYLLFINNLLTQIPKNLFENAEHLNAIYLTKNGLLEIDFSYFYEHPIMTYIDARYNRITTLRNDDRTKVLTIRHISVKDNYIQRIEDRFFSNFPFLRNILLSNNRLREIPHDICNGTTLLNIYLDNNKIQHLQRNHFLSCSHTTFVNISRNQIKSVESNTFRDMTSLQTVFLTNNDIKYLATNSFSSISPLQTINLEGNKISYINSGIFGNISTLQNLLLKNNLLAEIPTQLFNQIPYLLALTLNQNKIKEIPNGAFTDLKNLRNLKLQSNEIIQLRRETFKELPKLGSLTLSGNVFQSVNFEFLDHFAWLYDLDLSFCRFNSSTLNQDLLPRITRIKNLNLAGNNLSTIAPTFLGRCNLIRILDISYSHLKSYQVGDILSKKPQYLLLTINGLGLKSIPKELYRTSTKTRNLILNDHKIQTISPTAITFLQYIKFFSLQRNQLGNDAFISLIKLHQLTDLYLNSNNITDVCPSSSLSDKVANLFSLDISDNKISTLKDRCFSKLSNLKTLILRNNPIQEFSREAFITLYNIRDLYSTREYLCCDAPPTTTLCEPLPDQFSISTCSNVLSHDVLRIFVWIIGSLSIVGNIISIVWHVKSFVKNNMVVQTLLINLSFADLIMGIYLITIAVTDIYYFGIYAQYLETWLHSVICVMASFLVAISSLMSTFILFLITLDRYLFLVYPFENYRLSYKLITLVLIVLWTVSAAFTALPLVYSYNQPASYRLYGTNSACLPGNTDNIYYLSWLLTYCGTTLLTWIVIAIMYIIILVYLTKSRKQAKREISKFDKIVRAKMITIVITDLICWMPLYVVLIQATIEQELDTHVLPFIAVLSLPLNSCINPIIYTIYTTTFVNNAMLIITKIRSCCSCCIRCSYEANANSDACNGELEPNRNKALAAAAKQNTNPKIHMKVNELSPENLSTSGLLKIYSLEDRSCWEREKAFFLKVKSSNYKFQNIVECLWFRDESESKSSHEKPSFSLSNKLITCYALNNQDTELLSDLIAYQPCYLTPQSFFHILRDVTLAVQSFHARDIIHGCIKTDSIFIVSSNKQIEKIRVLLGNFSCSQILQNTNSENADITHKINPKLDDIMDISQLCQCFISFCQSKMDPTSNPKQNLTSPATSNWIEVVALLHKVKTAMADFQTKKLLPETQIAQLLLVLEPNVKKQ